MRLLGMYHMVALRSEAQLVVLSCYWKEYFHSALGLTAQHPEQLLQATNQGGNVATACSNVRVVVEAASMQLLLPTAERRRQYTII